MTLTIAEAEMVEKLQQREREVAALAAEVERLRMGLGAIRIINIRTLNPEVSAICDLALGEVDQ